MHCSEVRNLLSAYHDDELSSAEQAAVANHLSNCQECSREFLQFQELSNIAGTLRDPVAPRHIWGAIERQLPSAGPAKNLSARRPRRIAGSVLGILAVLLVAVWLATAFWKHPDEHQVVAVFGEYLDAFPQDPAAAQQLLLASFEHSKIDRQQADGILGYHSAVARGLPNSYRINATYVLKMPCCTCMQCLCEDEQGNKIAIFEHNDVKEEWFGDRVGMEVACSGKPCHVLELSKGLAATWRRGSRKITVVGAENLEELGRLVAWFERTDLE